MAASPLRLSMYTVLAAITWGARGKYFSADHPASEQARRIKETVRHCRGFMLSSGPIIPPLNGDGNTGRARPDVGSANDARSHALSGASDRSTWVPEHFHAVSRSRTTSVGSGSIDGPQHTSLIPRTSGLDGLFCRTHGIERYGASLPRTTRNLTGQSAVRNSGFESVRTSLHSLSASKAQCFINANVGWKLAAIWYRRRFSESPSRAGSSSPATGFRISLRAAMRARIISLF